MRQALKEEAVIPQWEEDYKLNPLPDHHLFWEYLEVGKMTQIAANLLLPTRVSTPSLVRLTSPSPTGFVFCISLMDVTMGNILDFK